MSHNAQTAVEQVLVTLALMGIALLVAAVIASVTDRLRKAARTCDEALKSVAPSSEKAEPRVTIPAQRRGGESSAR